MRCGGIAALVVFAAALESQRAAAADVRITFYIGASQTAPSDLRLTQRARGNDVTFKDVRWTAYPLRASPYYGLRLTYAISASNAIDLDFTHYKIYGRTEDSVEQIGTWHGSAIQETSAMNAHVQSIEVTHGVNMLALTLSARRGNAVIAAGPTIYLPHAESRVDGVPYESTYQFGGSGAKIRLGIDTCVRGRRVDLDAQHDWGLLHFPIAEGTARTALSTMHESIDVALHRC